ncbi:copper resistance system multicopper oxidase [Caulobacter sp. NIBR2454]|uniref:copper resistance system multicopper oxidase n=1 Tax=Caulobacter sp. NIBR2454 TaxID=3015996 RepID=UPI0022B73C0D|nr:copper resistance system multicopper oxidase [Caulobacter sp. NIBR2454]
MRTDLSIGRRGLLRAAAAFAGVGASGLLPAWARAASSDRPAGLSGEDIKLTIGHATVKIDGRTGHAVTTNGTVPGPLIRLREGQNVRIAVTNTLDEDTSIHWHGLLVPFQMDGVPGVSFPGIKPGETFVYEFPIIQSGTYWYHSHSGLQELEGHYGPIIIDPKGDEPAPYDREHVVVLSDYSFLHPHKVLQKLKQQAGVFNQQKQTVAGLLAGKDQSLKERVEWSGMRMDPTDILDVTGSIYSFLINGHGPKDNWTGLFQPGERVRLRFINAASMTVFNVRIPGLKLSVVQADGEAVRPVAVDEFQISPAETYDIIVQPTDDRAYTLVAEAADRSGMARGTLAPRVGMTAAVPPLRQRPVLGMKDMGMDGGAAHAGMDHSGMSMRDPANAPQVKMGPGVQMISPMPMDRTGEPGVGLADVGHRVLVYTDLAALQPNPDPRPPSRTMQIHLTGNMERFMWGFDGKKFSELTKPIAFTQDERVRVTLVNDTMMSHPIHLHGHFFEVVTGNSGHHPRKHTVTVQPGGKVSFDLTADAPGDWAFHCHMLLHMHAGMFNVVTVRPAAGAQG